MKKSSLTAQDREEILGWALEDAKSYFPDEQLAAWFDGGVEGGLEMLRHSDFSVVKSWLDSSPEGGDMKERGVDRDEVEKLYAEELRRLLSKACAVVDEKFPYHDEDYDDDLMAECIEAMGR